MKIGRNEKCFCGSGLKYKHCHGDLLKQMQVEAAAKEAAKEKMAELIEKEQANRGVDDEE